MQLSHNSTPFVASIDSIRPAARNASIQSLPPGDNHNHASTHPIIWNGSYQTPFVTSQWLIPMTVRIKSKFIRASSKNSTAKTQTKSPKCKQNQTSNQLQWNCLDLLPSIYPIQRLQSLDKADSRENNTSWNIYTRASQKMCQPILIIFATRYAQMLKYWLQLLLLT